MIAEPLLNPVLHLFALQAAASSGHGRELARQRVLGYLHDHVGLANAATYIGLYDDLLELHDGDDAPVLLEHATTMAGRLRELLHGFERHVALLHFVELATIDREARLPLAIADVIGGAFGVTAESLGQVVAFMSDPASCAASGGPCRRIGGDPARPFRGDLAVLHLAADGLLLVAPIGDEAVRLEGRLLTRGRCQALGPGHVLRDDRGNELHVDEIVAAFSAERREGPRLVLRGRGLEFRFPGSASGLHEWSFEEHSGRLVAIMGASGSGKSTLLGILNGTIRPGAGELRINGHDVHADPSAAEGVFGYIPQEDLLFEDLTVFENLYYAARLCRADLREADLVQRVHALLADLGQAETANLKVGSPLEQTISGGQRKRLNIALELIREPAVLFADEPTSGLSSADSEMVMSLLKQQARRGTLVFVVIHQPSSRIFRMFDALWILDQGGWPIFAGTPIEAIAYFRSRGGLAGADEGICPGCGSVRPEEIFEIVEARLLGRGGRPTHERRVSPEAWAQSFRDYQTSKALPTVATVAPPLPEGNLVRPGHLGQLAVHFARDVRARLSNRAYVAVTLLEPPLLGLLLALLSRGVVGGGYSFHDNEHVAIFFFMSVIVALFLGLSVSAEEICRDARSQQRERFLHLSWWSYIHSKALYLALVAGVQMLLYVAVALPIVEVPDFFAESWLVLFACAFSASLLGLNISASFRSAVTIYVLVPILLIPQMLLSGAIISYDHLLAPDALRRDVPFYANLLPARWGYEALVVEQYAGNQYARRLLDVEARVKLTEDDLDFYLPELEGRIESVGILRSQGQPEASVEAQVRILERELRRLPELYGIPLPATADDFRPASFDRERAEQLGAYVKRVRAVVFAQRRDAAEERQRRIAAMEKALGQDGAARLQRTHTSQDLERLVLNQRVLEPVGAAADGLFRRTLPVFRLPESRWGSSHFLAGQKRLGPWLVRTYTLDVAAIFLLAGAFHLALGLRLLPRLFTWTVRVARRRRPNRQ